MKYWIAILALIVSTTIYAENNTNPIKIAIVDTGLDLSDSRFKGHICSNGHQSFVGDSLNDVNGHGTHVAGLIQHYAGDGNYCFLVYKYYSIYNTGVQNLSNEIKAFRAAVDNRAAIVNLSGGGPEYSYEEYSVIKANPNVTFVVAAGNNSKDIDIKVNHYYPASYDLPNIIVVGSIDNRASVSSFSNWGKKVNWEIGENVLSYFPYSGYVYLSGTSMATAIRTGKIVHEYENKIKKDF